jgi:Na+-translocating ferredoxin:NAD+ oxidoreductase RnfG subunit
MTALLTFILSPIGRYVAVALLIAAALGGLYFKVTHDAVERERAAQRAAQLKASLEAQHTRQKVDDDVSRMGDDALRDALRRWVPDDGRGGVRSVPPPAPQR